VWCWWHLVWYFLACYAWLDNIIHFRSWRHSHDVIIEDWMRTYRTGGRNDKARLQCGVLWYWLDTITHRYCRSAMLPPCGNASRERRCPPPTRDGWPWSKVKRSRGKVKSAWPCWTLWSASATDFTSAMKPYTLKARELSVRHHHHDHHHHHQYF